MEFILSCGEQIVFFVVNLVVGIVVFRAYFKAADREWPLLLLGISSIFGMIGTVGAVVLWFFFEPDQAFDAWISIRLLGLIDAGLWTTAVCTLIGRYVRMQRRSPAGEAVNS